MHKCSKCMKKKSNSRLKAVKVLNCAQYLCLTLSMRWSKYKPIKYGMVRLAGSSLCSCDVDEDAVYRMRVRPGRDEVLKVGELTDTGTDTVSRSALNW